MEGNRLLENKLCCRCFKLWQEWFNFNDMMARVSISCVLTFEFSREKSLCGRSLSIWWLGPEQDISITTGQTSV